MLRIPYPCSGDKPLSLHTHSPPNIIDDDVVLEGYHTVKALFQETRLLIAANFEGLSEPVGLALRRCEANQERLETLLYGLGYSVPCGQESISNSIEWKLKRYLKRNEQTKLQGSYRDAVFLLRDIAMRRVFP